MTRSTRLKGIGIVMALALLVVGTPVAMGFFAPLIALPSSQVLAPPQQSTAITFADPAMKTTWERTDLPVQNGLASRSWMWGPTSIFSGNEPWAESPGGQHLVQYFDKSRMEVNDPKGDRNSQWFVTNGLLVVEMMTGNIMTGATSSIKSQPALVPVAGDANTSVNAPTYATLAKVASLDGNNRAPDRTGQPVNQILDRAGNVTTAAKTQDQVVDVVYEPTLGHNIPNVFWTFMNQTGTVYQNGQYVTDKVFDWLFAMGYPLTEPYWIQISVGGQQVWVVMQAYQRRIITYNPNNDPSFQVEMGNAGQSYYDWRYNQQGSVLPTTTPVPAATVAPAPATLALSPQAGPADTTITVVGTGFTPWLAVQINVSAANIKFDRTVATVGADAGGNFTTYVTLPDEVAAQTGVVITASGPNGVPKLSQTFTINHNAKLEVSPVEVTSKGIVRLMGDDFPANTQITISAYQAGQGQPLASIAVTTDANGSFDTTYTLVGRAAVGAQYTIVATGPNNLKTNAQSTIKIIPMPSANVNPFSGPAGVNVTFSGSSWSPNRLLTIKLQGDNGQYQNYLPPNPVVTDGAGNFATSVLIPQQYAGQTKVLLWATDDVTGISMSAPYTLINPVPPPANPKLNVVPNPIQSSQQVQVYGTGYPAGQLVTVGVGVVNGPVGPMATANTDGQGNFNTTFSLPSSLASAGMVTIAATSTDGTNANMNVPVVNNSGGSPPPDPGTSGLAMEVRVSYYGGPGSVALRGSRWTAGQPLTAVLFATDGSLNQTVGTSTVRPDGTFQINFDKQSSWASRTDLKVKVTAANGQTSTRYLPETSKVNTGAGTYTFNGINWPRGTKVTAEIRPIQGNPVSVGSVTTDGNGVFTLNIIVPANLKGNVNTIDVFTDDQQYSASFTP